MPLSNALARCAALALGLALFAATSPWTSGDAEAGRVRINPVGAASAVIRHHNRQSGEESSEESSANSATEEGKPEDAPADTAASSAPAPARAQAVTIAKKPAPPKDAEVPGCSPGMICIICLAGCTGATNSIVHAAPRTQKLN